jgi:RNA-directed DNA polymerase
MNLYEFVEQQRPQLKRTLRSQTHEFPLCDEVTEHKLSAALLLSLETTQDVCAFFEVPRALLEQLLNFPVYQNFSIAKKRGGTRMIEAPEGRLMQVQRRLNHGLQSLYLCDPDPAVFGFVRNKEHKNPASPIVQNALPHVDKSFVLNIDLKDFFPSIRAHRVKELFLSERFGFNESMATVLALLTTHKGHLPQGAPTSPILTNFICAPMDVVMRELSEKNAWNYTRYADDLTFSSSKAFEDKDIMQIRHIVEMHDFAINDKKIRIKGKGRRQEVTGIVVNSKVNVNRKTIKKVRAMIHDLEKNGLTVAAASHFKNSPVVHATDSLVFLNRLRGLIAFIGQVRGKEDSVFLQFQEKIRVW